MLFYSVLGPDGAKFKIKELDMKVYVRKLTSQTLKFKGTKKLKGERFNNQQHLAPEAEVTMKCDQFRFAEIKASLKWKLQGSAATLALKLYKEGDNGSRAEFELKKLEANASSAGYSTWSIEFPREKHETADVFLPRRLGWSGIT